jgi:FkbM family methyltransferase
MNNFSTFLKTLPFPENQTILLVDIGARWGANPPWDQLDNKYLTYIGFEPDEGEYRSLIAKYKSSNITYIPIALSDAVEDHILHVTREPGCSSIFQPNLSIISRFLLSERWDIQKEIQIKTVPLAKILDERHIVPDILKIDVQGAALKVLRGARHYLSDVLLIEVEVEFCEMYKGEPLFGDVDKLIRQHGFELLDINKYYARRKILDTRYMSRGQVLFADVLYVMSVDRFYSLNMSPAERVKKLWNLVIILCIYGHFDLALEFVFHEKSTLVEKDKLAIKSSIQKYTAIPMWKLTLFNNSFIEKLGFVLSLLANSMQIKSRLFGWGSDQSAVDSRYKYYFKHPILKLFRK